MQTKSIIIWAKPGQGLWSTLEEMEQETSAKKNGVTLRVVGWGCLPQQEQAIRTVTPVSGLSHPANPTEREMVVQSPECSGKNTH